MRRDPRNVGAFAASKHREVSEMHSSMIGKIEKAHRYAQEPDRVRLDALSASFRGSHDEYRVELRDGHWHCSCHTFESHVVGTCSHVMALQQILGNMLSPDYRYSLETASTQPALA